MDLSLGSYFSQTNTLFFNLPIAGTIYFTKTHATRKNPNTITTTKVIRRVKCKDYIFDCLKIYDGTVC